MATAFKKDFVIAAGVKLIDLCDVFLREHQKDLSLPAEKIRAVALNLALSTYRAGGKDTPSTLSCTTSDWTNCTRFRKAATPALMRVGDVLQIEWTENNGAVQGHAVVMPKAVQKPAVQIGQVYRLGDRRLRVTELETSRYGLLAVVEPVDGKPFGADEVTVADLKPL